MRRSDYEGVSNARKVGTCAECGADIYDDNADVYIDDDGNYFCSLECCLAYYGIHQAEDCYVNMR